METKGIKAEDMRACDKCGGPLTGEDRRQIVFYVVRVSTAAFDIESLRERKGLSMILGRADGLDVAGLAEVFASRPYVAQELPATRLLLCVDCYMPALAATVEEVEKR